MPDSPIEVKFLEALKAWTAGSGAPLAQIGDGSWVAKHDGLVLAVLAQAPVGPYRADFAIMAWRGMEHRQIAVELDGHDFHEKTKEQAAKDKRRDRYFTSRGLGFVRFTGSEVHRDAAECVAEAMGCLLAQPIRIVNHAESE